jgi:hypothetical protein
LQKYRGAYLIWVVLGALALASCRGDAVVFAPPPPPPEIAPLRYDHPSRAFSVRVPQRWSRQERHATTLASVAFAPVGAHTPLVYIAVIRLPQPPQGAADVRDLLDAYQASIRPDVSRYTEQTREAMSDGSWRITGLRTASNGSTQRLNTFIVIEADMVGVMDVVLTDDATLTAELEAIANSFTVQTALAPSSLETLRFAGSARLEALNLHTWQTPDGVFYVTGEIANYRDRPVADVPVTVTLQTADGRDVAQASDRVMGYGIIPGGFAPFSLRFGEGQAPLTAAYTLTVGGPGWELGEPPALYAEDVLTWTDESTLSENGGLQVVGDIRNTSADVFVYLPRVVVTVFDEAQRVIGAGFADLDDVEIAPGETTPFQIVLPEVGGNPSRYIVQVQGQP